MLSFTSLVFKESYIFSTVFSLLYGALVEYKVGYKITKILLNDNNNEHGEILILYLMCDSLINSCLSCSWGNDSRSCINLDSYKFIREPC